MPTPRKPDEIKILDGTFRADRDGDPAASVVASGTPERPANLKGDARKLWDAQVPGLIERGLAKSADLHELAGMCEWYARYCRLGRAVDRTPATGKGSGNLAKLLVAAGIAWDKFDRIAQRFGLTPADRAKLRAPANQTKDKGGVASRKRG